MNDGYYHHYPPQPMAPEAPTVQYVYGYDQYTARRSKTPTSLVNHTGLSPAGPISTPPRSRDASQGPDPPPARYPEPMVYDDSQSSSPTSVRTPENDHIEEDLTLDSHSMRELDQANVGMATHESLTGVDNMFLTAQETIPDSGMRPANRWLRLY